MAARFLDSAHAEGRDQAQAQAQALVQSQTQFELASAKQEIRQLKAAALAASMAQTHAAVQRKADAAAQLQDHMSIYSEMKENEEKVCVGHPPSPIPPPCAGEGTAPCGEPAPAPATGCLTCAV